MILQLAILPRARLAHLPTPLQELPTLSKRLGGPRIYVKRDDLTGLAFGGNKLRKLEFLLGDAQQVEADVIVAGVQGFQSNHLCQTAAAARRLGMGVVLVKTGPRDGYDPPEYDGNHLLQYMLGAEMIVRVRDHAPTLDEVAEELKAKGRRPYVISHAGSTPLGTAGYVNAVLELLAQTTAREVPVDYIVHATGSGGTQAGLILGAKALNTDIQVLGVSVEAAHRTEALAQVVLELLQSSTRVLDLDLSPGLEDVHIVDGYSEGGYGVINEGKVQAMTLVAQTEGLFLDPVYTGTAMAGLIDLIRRGYFSAEDTVVFLHTGGHATLFPYKVPITSLMRSEPPPWTRPPWSA